MLARPLKRYCAAVRAAFSPYANSVCSLVLCTFILAGCQGELYSGLSQREANEILSALNLNDITAERSGSGEIFSVSVSSQDMGAATTILQQMGLPRAQYKQVTDLFPGDSLIVTPFEQGARMAFALGQELAQTIEGIDGVQAARVHVVLPERDLRERIVSEASASVVIHYSGNQTLSIINEQVRLIVANAVPALTQDKVSISNFAAGAADKSESVAVNASADSEYRMADAVQGSLPAPGFNWPSLGIVFLAISAVCAFLALLYFALGSRGLQRK